MLEHKGKKMVFASDALHKLWITFQHFETCP